VNANLAAIGIGTETSGSILSPGSVNMLVGIKPTRGLVSRTGIVPITADQDTAGPLARTVTDAAILLGVIAGFDQADPATAPCLTPGNCFDDYTQFLDKHALRGARIAVPKFGYWSNDKAHTEIFLSVQQERVMNDAIDVLRQQGADVEVFDIPNQDDLNNFGGCGSANPPDTGMIPQNCSIVLLYGFKRDLNKYLATLGPGAPIQTLSDVVAYNKSHSDVALKYGLRDQQGHLLTGQDLAVTADRLDTSDGSADTMRYLSDRAKDLDLYKVHGLDVVYASFDAVLFPANFGAGIAAKAGYPSIVVPGGRVPNPAVPQVGNPPPPFPDGFNAKDAPFGVTFSGPAFSEPKLIGYAFAFEQATLHRRPPDSTPPLP
jgi:amidase